MSITNKNIENSFSVHKDMNQGRGESLSKILEWVYQLKDSNREN